MPLTVRDAETAEVEDACDLWTRAEVARTGREPSDADARDFLESMRLATAKPGARLLVGIAGDQLVATIYGVPLRTDKTKAQVAMLAVEPALWGNGFGRRMLNELSTALLEQGCRHLRMNVDAANERARRLYEAQGWRHEGETEQVDEADEPELVYRVDLGPAGAQ